MNSSDIPGSKVVDHRDTSDGVGGCSWDACMDTAGGSEQQVDLLVGTQDCGLNFLDTELTPSGSDGVSIPFLNSGSSQRMESERMRYVPVNGYALHPTGQSVVPGGGALPHRRSTRGRPGVQYESMIDPNLSEEEKKKTRRLLSNRASAKRARERKAQLIQEMSEQLKMHSERVHQLETMMTDLEIENKKLRQTVASLQQRILARGGA
ncbi:hypothetical protein M9434_005939 [Picochlorum sp. BPE23]|nr:hypothetical protein M9434_005939 [Picochlorum sp. BPE23]